MDTLIIDRKRWHRGQGGGGSALYVPATQMMCCLGFECERRGFTIKEMDSIVDPESLFYDGVAHELRGLISASINTPAVEDLIRLNDLQLGETSPGGQTPTARRLFPAANINLETEEQREKAIEAIFREELGIEVTFVDTE